MTDTNETQSEKQSTAREPAVDAAAKALVDIGLLWARHGLSVGKLALQTSAATLQATASALETLSTRLSREPEPEADTIDVGADPV